MAGGLSLSIAIDLTGVVGLAMTSPGRYKCIAQYQRLGPIRASGADLGPEGAVRLAG